MIVLSLSFEIFSTYKKNNAINMMSTEAINETLIELKLSANKRLKSTIKTAVYYCLICKLKELETQERKAQNNSCKWQLELII